MKIKLYVHKVGVYSEYGAS